MNKKTLLVIGGTINALFVLFHIVMVYSIHVGPGISQNDRPLMEMLAIGGAIMITFLTVASFFYRKEMLTTKIGKLVSILSIVIYWSRAVEEIFISPRFSPIIFISCLIIGAVYMMLLIPSNVPEKELESVA